MSSEQKPWLIALGASTGGTKALAALLSDLADKLVAARPVVVVTQHIDPGFAGALAASLDKAGSLAVSLANHGERLQPGHVYLAPGDRHLLVGWDGTGYRCQLDDGPPRDKCKPSVDAMFESLLGQPLDKTVAILLTGMGKDGANALKALRQQGAHTVAQDEASSVVWGMPGEAVRLDAVDTVVAIEDMAQKITEIME
ncbi:MAG: CheB methylesterase domain-containing protein [Porticoccaceae bacterium]|nr:CheB methylesterase domain-containing protein [Porticoccaceae bacterium]